MSKSVLRAKSRVRYTCIYLGFFYSNTIFTTFLKKKIEKYFKKSHFLKKVKSTKNREKSSEKPGKYTFSSKSADIISAKCCTTSMMLIICMKISTQVCMHLIPDFHGLPTINIKPSSRTASMSMPIHDSANNSFNKFATSNTFRPCLII